MKVSSAIILVCMLIFSYSCKKTCKTCVHCKSFYSTGVQANEVTKCDTDTAYINGYETGFILGAEESNKTPLCFDHFVECKTKRQWEKQ